MLRIILRGRMAGLNGCVYEWGQVKSCTVGRIIMNAPIARRLQLSTKEFNKG